jgi:hypothetical protein
MKKLELVQAVEKKGKCFRSIAPIICRPEIGWTESRRKVNENNMLDRRFSVAPMMDWSETSSLSIT